MDRLKIEMYEPHKDNRELIEAENRRMTQLNDECQVEIEGILKRENLNARIVFYPGYEPTDPDGAWVRREIEDVRGALDNLEKEMEMLR